MVTIVSSRSVNRRPRDAELHTNARAMSGGEEN